MLAKTSKRMAEELEAAAFDALVDDLSGYPTRPALCPFCGSKPEIIESEPGIYGVECRCGSSFYLPGETLTAIRDHVLPVNVPMVVGETVLAGWNRRAGV